jgi:glycosyltransferase involved in cell wall biosynthesis
MPYYETTWCYRVAKKRGMRFVLEIHGDWETALLDEDSSSLFRKATRRFRALASRQIVAEMATNATCVLAVGPRLLEKYVPKGVPSLVSTNHLLREEVYCRRTDFALKDPPRILFVGDMQRRKGLHILFQALASLSNSGRRFEMMMVGSGPMIRELQAYASRQGFRNSVRFVGRVAHGEELYQYFRGSDLFVLPSIAAEGVPRVTHEAAALGCPVIATDVGSVAWQLQDGAGIVVPPGNAEHLAIAILKVLDNADLRQSLSEKGFLQSLKYTYEKQQIRITEFVAAHLSN